MKARHAPRAIVVTIGPWHDEPWWWTQLEGNRLRSLIGYERISIGNRTHHQLGWLQLPRLLLRIARLLRAARAQGTQYIFTFEADITCYLIGLLQWIPLFSGPKHVILQFITQENDGSPRARLKDLIARFCLATVHKIIVSSMREGDYYRERFRWSKDKIAFVPFHTDQKLIEKRPLQSIDAIVAAGRSYRDYRTLAAAVAGTGIRTIVVCGRSGPGLSEVPPEMEVVHEMPLAQLLDLMAAARIVVLPLQHRRISTGQTVLLQAMSLGRPLITTLTAGTEDYVRHDIDGVLVPPTDPQALRKEILRLWNDSHLCTQLADRAFERINSRHLPTHYASAVAAALNCTVREDLESA